MRRVIVAAGILLALLNSLAAAPTPPGADFETPQAVLQWINRYRVKPEPARMPQAVKALSRLGALKDSENAGVYVGFIAGVLGANPDKADALIARMFPLPDEDQWAIVRAVAYSGLPDWRGVLRRAAPRMPTRQVMITKQLAGQLATLDQLKLEDEPGMLAKVWGYVRVDKVLTRKRVAAPVVLAPSPDVLDTLWGNYFGSGDSYPALRIVAMMRWSKEQEDVEKLTVGAMAKYTLAVNSSRDPRLLALLKDVRRYQSKEAAPILADVIDAAETAETGRIRKQALGAIEDLRRKGPSSSRNVAWWGKVGEGAISLGCVVAAATGQVELGLPCVVGGALTSVAVRYWATP